MILSHGNADPERGFSENKRLVTDMRCSLSQSTITGYTATKDALKFNSGDPMSVPITKPLIHAFREASKRYRDALRDEKRMKKNALQKMEEDKSRKRHQTDLSDLEKERQSLSAQIQSANETLQEASSRLSLAVKKSNMAEISVSSALVESMTNLLKELHAKCTTLEEVLKKKKKRFP